MTGIRLFSEKSSKNLCNLILKNCEKKKKNSKPKKKKLAFFLLHR